MLRSERLSIILQQVKEYGFVRNEDLCKKFGVTSATIRRDLKDLAEQDLLQLDHGGAFDHRYLNGFTEPLYQAKLFLCIAQKRRIGLSASRYIENGDTIILDSGTTTLQIARALKGNQFTDLTVITYDLKIADELCPEPNITIIMLGGIVRKSLYSLYGPYTQAFLKDLRANKTFLAIDGATKAHGVLNANLEEVPVKQLIVQNSDTVFLVADSTKFGKNIPFKVCDWTAIDKVITDDGLQDEYRDFLVTRNIGIEIAEVPNLNNKGE